MTRYGLEHHSHQVQELFYLRIQTSSDTYLLPKKYRGFFFSDQSAGLQSLPVFLF